MRTHTHNHFKALWILSGTTRVSRYHRGHQKIIPICLLHLLQSMASSLFKPHALQSFPQSLVPSISYSIHFFTQMRKVILVFDIFSELFYKKILCLVLSGAFSALMLLVGRPVKN